MSVSINTGPDDEKVPLIGESSDHHVQFNSQPIANSFNTHHHASEDFAISPSGWKRGYTGGIIAMLFVTFLSSVCFSIVLPSIWPYLKSMGEQKSMVGWAVAINSVGSFLASPIFGWWSDRRTTKEVVGASLVIMIGGNLMYSLARNFWVLLIARFVVGVAAGNYAVAQTYLSYATTQQNRTFVMTLNSAVTVLGFIIGPAFAMVTTVSFLNFSIKEIQVDKLTSPGYISCILSIIGLISLMFLKEIPPSARNKPAPRVAPKGGSRSNVGSGFFGTGSGFYTGGGSVVDVTTGLKELNDHPEIKVPWLAVIVCNWAYFAYTGAFTIFETIGTEYTEEDFKWDVFENSLLYGGMGLECILALVLLQIPIMYLPKRTGDRILLCATTFLMACGYGLLINPSHHGLVSKPIFAIGVTLNSMGYATAVAVLISIYTKILESLDQGFLMGWLSASGSFARIVGPIAASYVFQYGGAFPVFLPMTGLLLTTFLLLVASWKPLAPRGKD